MKKWVEQLKQKKEERQLQKKQLALEEAERKDLIHRISPKGGIRVATRYLEHHNGYECYIHLTAYPYENVPLWLEWLKPMNGRLYVSIDPNLDQSFKKNISHSYDELNSQYKRESDPLKQNAIYQRIEELTPMMTLINSNEPFVRLVTRIQLQAKTLSELEDKVTQMVGYLEKHDYSGMILLEEQLNEWQNGYRSITKDPYKRYGKIVPIQTIAGGYLANQRELADPIGYSIGVDELGNQVLFNPFYKDGKRRQASNGMLIGNSGSGKSTFLFGKLGKNHLMLGDYVRFIDPVGDGARMMRDMGGLVISIDGSSGEVLNPLAKITMSDEGEGDNLIQLTVNKATTWLSLIAPSLNDYELHLFSSLLSPLYEIKEQPILSDVYQRIQQCLSENLLSENKKKYYEHLEIVLSDLITTHGKLFNRPTTLQMNGANGICFLVRDLVAQAEPIRQAQFFNIFYFLWQEMIELGKVQKAKVEQGRPKEEITQYLLLCDEAHHYLNTKSKDMVERIKLFMREDRKYEAGLWFATQSILDIDRESVDENSEALKSIFGFCQFSVIFNEKANAQASYHKLLSHRLTAEEIESIMDLKKGEFLINIDGEPTFKVDSIMDYKESDLAWIGGGK